MRILLFLWTWAALLLSGSVSFAQIQGKVFQDGNASGTQEAFEAGLSGIRVQAFNAQSELLTQSRTDAQGQYHLDLPAGQAVLLRFSELPKGLTPTPGFLLSRFVKAPATSDLGLYHPSLFAGSSPQVLQVLYVNGDYSSPLADSLPSLVRFSALHPSGRPQILARAKQTGSLWGLTYDRSSTELFAAAVAKRHSAFGPLGPGGIYRFRAGKGLEPFLSLEELGIATAPKELNRDLFGDPAQASHDSLFFATIGKISLGGIDLSADGKQLYVVNLYDQKLYQLTLPASKAKPTAEQVKAFTLPAPDSKTGVFRPWAVHVHEGRVYVGGVSDASLSQNVKDLKAYVYALNPENGKTSLVLSFPLSYSRGTLDYAQSGWQAWTDDYLKTFTQQASSWMIYPQPILADLEFDTDGSLILGLMDRLGHQATDGMLYRPAGKAALMQYRCLSGGDVLRAAELDGRYVLEANGQAGLKTSGGAGNGQGPGGGEFYVGDAFEAEGTIWHQESGIGGLALLPQRELLVSMREAQPGAYVSGGVRWLSNETGQMLRSYSSITRGMQPGYSFKNNNVGDVALVKEVPPSFISSRVFLDCNGNGIAEADETPLAGLTVELYQKNQRVAQATTNTDGYCFFVLGALETQTPYELRLPFEQAGQPGLKLSPVKASHEFASQAIAKETYAFITGQAPGLGAAAPENLSFGLACTATPEGLVRLQCLSGGKQASLVLERFSSNLRYDISAEVTYKGIRSFISAEAVPKSGLLASVDAADLVSPGYAIRLFNGEGCLKDLFISAEQVATCRQVLGKDALIEGLTAAPNPTSGIVQVVYQQAGAQATATLQLLTLEGKLIKQQSLVGEGGRYRSTLDLTTQPVGSYLISIQLEGRTASQIIIKR